MQVEHNGSEGWAHFAGNATSGNPFVRFEPVYKALKPSTTYTFLAEVEGTFNNSSNVNLAFYSGTSQTDAIDPFSTSLAINVKDGGTFYRTGKTRADVSASTVLNRGYLQVYGTGTFDCYIRISLYEGEYSGPYKPYVDQTLSNRVKTAETSIKENAESITLRATKTEMYQSAQPNLTPYFLMDMSQTTDTYWSNITVASFTQQEDGWAHFEYTNTGTKTANNYIKPKIINTLEPAGKYTLLAEFRNVSISMDGGSFYSQQGNDLQVWGDSSYCGFNIANATIRALPNGEGKFYRTITLLDAQSKDPKGTVRGTLPKTAFMSINQQVQAGQSISYDLRLSLYEGEYDGPYKPFSGNKLYATNTELEVTNDAVDIVVQETKEVRDSVDAAQESADNAKVAADSANAAAAQAQADIDAQVETIGKHFTFSTNGLAISNKGDSSGANILLDESKLTFRNGTDELAYAQGTTFKAPTMEADEMHLGNWMWVHRNNSNLSLK